VVGTSGPDTIQVTETNGRVTAAVNQQSWSFSSSQVNAIQVDGYGGNDVILLNMPGSNLPAVLNGGSGNDLLWADAGNATLIAGPGNDFLIAGGGADRLYGGNGNDVLVSGQINPASPLSRPGELESLARQWAKSSTSSRFRTALTQTLKRAVQDDGSADQMWGGSGWNLFFKGKNAVVEDPTRRDVVIPVASLSGTGRSTVHVKRANPVKVKVATVKTAVSCVVRVRR
jgi:Ca2+-binding RTX toxin-like protein